MRVGVVAWGADAQAKARVVSYRGRDGSRVSGAGSRVPPGALALRIARVCIARGRGPPQQVSSVDRATVS